MNRRVLLVEDDRDLRELLSLALEWEGYVVSPAANGVEALVQLQFASAPDVILLNLVLPIMGGRDVLEAVRRDPRLAPIPVVLLTGAPVPVEVGRAADAVLAKPFDLAQLSGTIHHVVESRSPPTQTPPPAVA